MKQAAFAAQAFDGRKTNMPGAFSGKDECTASRGTDLRSL
jgi:hypothetical protein